MASNDTCWGDTKGCCGGIVFLGIILVIIGAVFHYWYVAAPILVLGLFFGTGTHNWLLGALRGSSYHGVIRSGGEVTWKCSHTHRTLKAAELCSRKEADRRKREHEAQQRFDNGPGAV